MIFPIFQTPTAHGTPTVVVSNLPPQSQDKEGQQLRAMLEALKYNQVVRMDKTHLLAKTWHQINALRDLNENWGGCDVAAPNPAAVEQAKRWIASMHRDAMATGHPWTNPHVSAGEDGDVSFEWWQGHKKLTVYVSPADTLLLQVWGPNITSQMSEGTAETIQERQSAWVWLMS